GGGVAGGRVGGAGGGGRGGPPRGPALRACGEAGGCQRACRGASPTSATYSFGRLVPNMISSQEGTDDRRDRPPAAFLAGRSRVTAGAPSCCSCGARAGTRPRSPSDPGPLRP